MSFPTEKLFGIASMNEEEPDKTTLKTENRNRNEENRRQIIDFIADNGISDAKTISKASDSSPQEPATTLNNLWTKASLRWRGSIKQEV